MKILISGGSGFIGNFLVDFFLKKYSECIILNIDNLSYAALPGANDWAESTGRYTHERINIVDAHELYDAFERFRPDFVIHAAAESSVDFSLDAIKRHRFMETNVLGTNNMLEALRRCKNNPRMIYINTDEIYGNVLSGSSDENHPLDPQNPYAGSKAAAGMLVKSYFHSFGLNVLESCATNTWGPFQDNSKFIPKSILRVMQGKPILLNDKGQHVRSWLHVYNHCSAVEKILFNGTPGLSYNIFGGEELTNLKMAKLILKSMNKPKDFYTFAKLRSCDDLRYSVSSIRLGELGYSPDKNYNLKNSFQSVVDWYIEYYQKNKML